MADENITNFNMFKKETLDSGDIKSLLGKISTITTDNNINNIIKGVLEDVGNSEDENIFTQIKTLQRKYVHVSLFASLSYQYIQNIFEGLLTKSDAIITANKQKIAELEQSKSSSTAELQAVKAALQSSNEEYEALDNLLKERVNSLQDFINNYAANIQEQAKTQAEAQAKAQAGGKKKKQQKGGFVRDGTRAMLMGDPYPTAS